MLILVLKLHHLVCIIYVPMRTRNKKTNINKKIRGSSELVTLLIEDIPCSIKLKRLFCKH